MKVLQMPAMQEDYQFSSHKNRNRCLSFSQFFPRLKKQLFRHFLSVCCERSRFYRLSVQAERERTRLMIILKKIKDRSNDNQLFHKILLKSQLFFNCRKRATGCLNEGFLWQKYEYTINRVIKHTSIYSFYFLLCNSKNSNRLFFYVNIASVTAILMYHGILPVIELLHLTVLVPVRVRLCVARRQITVFLR